MGGSGKCQVDKCKSDPKVHPYLSFFQLPVDRQRSQLWCNNLKMSKYKKSFQICEKHFTYDQFTNIQRNRLKQNAVPTLIATHNESVDKENKSPNSPNQAHNNIQRYKKIQPRVPFGDNTNDVDFIGSSAGHSPIVGNSPADDTSWSTLNSDLKNMRDKLQQNGVEMGLCQPARLQDSAAAPCSHAPASTNTAIASNSFIDVSSNVSSLETYSTPSHSSPGRKIREMTKHVKRLQQANRRLKIKQSLSSPPDCDRIKKIFGKHTSMCELVTSQWTRYASSSRKYYNMNEKVIALTILYKCGKGGYQTLQSMGLRLPHLSSIRGWLKKSKFEPGLNKMVYECVEDRVKCMNEYERNCIFVWDEMHIKEFLQYNSILDEIEGFYDHGNSNRRLQPAKEVLVPMICGLNTSWTFPLSFYFSAGPTETADLCTIVRDNILACLKIGLKIRVAMSDQGIPNQGLFRWYGISEYTPFVNTSFFMPSGQPPSNDGQSPPDIDWPSIADEKIYFFFDPCHLIKLVRTHIQRHGFNTGPGQLVSWHDLVYFYELDSMTENRMAPKLNKYHFELTDMTRMKVKLATQLLSHSVYAGIKTLVDLGKMHSGSLATANFVKKMNDMFDLFNISRKDDEINPWKSGSKLFSRIKNFDKYHTWVSKWQCADGARLPDCVYGLKLTLAGMVMLLKDLQKEKYGYVLTRRIQQDCLEHYFSFQRGRGGFNSNPTSNQFKQNFKFLFLIRLMQNSEGANCEQYNESDIIASYHEKLNFILNYESSEHSPSLCGHSSDESSDEFEDDGHDYNDEFAMPYENSLDFFNIKENRLDLKDKNVVVYIGGWAVKNVTKETKCKKCQTLLLEHFNTRESTHISDNEIFLANKAYRGKDKLYKSNVNLGFGHILNNDARLIFEHINEYLHIAILETFNEIGTNLSKNIVKRLLIDGIIFEWVHTEPDCVKHRLKMINLIVRSRLFKLVRQKNETLKTPRSSKQSIGNLRHE